MYRYLLKFNEKQQDHRTTLGGYFFYQLLDSNLFPPYYLPSSEKPLVKPLAPGSIFHHISFRSTILQSFIFQIYKPKSPKIFYLLFSSIYLSLSNLTFASDNEGIDNPFIALGASVWFFVQVLVNCEFFSYWIDTLVLNWGKYLSLLCCITLSSSREKPTQAQEVAQAGCKGSCTWGM